MKEKLEQELSVFDFSLCHSVRESLLGKLLAMHRQGNATQHSHKWITARLSENELNSRGFGNLRRFMQAKARMDEEELDWVAAAGTGEGTGRNFAKRGEEWSKKP